MTPILLPSELEQCLNEGKTLSMNAWNVQNIVFEIVKNYMLQNTPQSVGFGFTQQHTEDPTTNTIFLDIAYNWRKDQQGKRPAVFIERDNLTMKYPTFSAKVGGNSKESESEHLVMQQMGVIISCVATNLGFTEMLAEYVRQPLVSFRNEIRRDFSFREFVLKGVSKPQVLTIEGKDHFFIQLELSTAFDEGFIVKSDDLKLKTISKFVFDSITGKSFSGQ